MFLWKITIKDIENQHPNANETALILYLLFSIILTIIKSGAGFNAHIYLDFDYLFTLLTKEWFPRISPGNQPKPFLLWPLQWQDIFPLIFWQTLLTNGLAFMVIYPCNMPSVIPIKVKPNLLNLPHGHTGLNPIIRCDPTIKEAEKKKQGRRKKPEKKLTRMS